MLSSKNIIFIAGISGAAATVLGALGAHLLSDAMTPQLIQAYKTAVNYHFIHTLALLAVGILLRTSDSRYLKASALALLLGILIFCGSLYALVLTGNKIWGLATPFGGISLIIGWCILAVSALKIKVKLL